MVNNFSALQRDGLLYINFLKTYDLLFCGQTSLNKILIFEKYTVRFREDKIQMQECFPTFHNSDGTRLREYAPTNP